MFWEKELISDRNRPFFYKKNVKKVVTLQPFRDFFVFCLVETRKLHATGTGTWHPLPL
jgi:hypothetical protein